MTQPLTPAAFDATLASDLPVEARWTSTGHRYVAPARVVKVNAKSLLVALTEDIPCVRDDGQLAYPANHVITLPRYASAGYSANNGAYPVAEEREVVDTAASLEALAGNIQRCVICQTTEDVRSHTDGRGRRILLCTSHWADGKPWTPTAQAFYERIFHETALPPEIEDVAIDAPVQDAKRIETSWLGEEEAYPDAGYETLPPDEEPFTSDPPTREVIVARGEACVEVFDAVAAATPAPLCAACGHDRPEHPGDAGCASCGSLAFIEEGEEDERRVALLLDLADACGELGEEEIRYPEGFARLYTTAPRDLDLAGTLCLEDVGVLLGKDGATSLPYWKVRLPLTQEAAQAAAYGLHGWNVHTPAEWAELLGEAWFAARFVPRGCEEVPAVEHADIGFSNPLGYSSYAPLGDEAPAPRFDRDDTAWLQALDAMLVPEAGAEPGGAVVATSADVEAGRVRWVRVHVGR